MVRLKVRSTLKHMKYVYIETLSDSGVNLLIDGIQGVNARLQWCLVRKFVMLMRNLV